MLLALQLLELALGGVVRRELLPHNMVDRLHLFGEELDQIIERLFHAILAAIPLPRHDIVLDAHAVNVHILVHGIFVVIEQRTQCVDNAR